jgi:hypothetical protein
MHEPDCVPVGPLPVMHMLAVDNRNHTEVRMKLTRIALLMISFFVVSSYAEEPPRPAPPPEIGSNVVPKVKPLACPQCGVWHVSETEIMIVDEKRVIIPGCGVFEYKTDRSIATSERVDRYVYKVSMSLTQQKRWFLCDTGDNRAWKMEANVSGHFRHAGTAEFVLRKNATAEPSLWLSGWNIDREDPCDAGSAFGTISCVSIENSGLYRMLSEYAERAFITLMGEGVRKLPSFNPANFAANVDKYCYDREKESGGGSWPSAYAAMCENGIFKTKFREFAAWHKCMDGNGRKWALCKFPNETFSRAKPASD